MRTYYSIFCSTVRASLRSSFYFISVTALVLFFFRSSLPGFITGNNQNNIPGYSADNYSVYKQGEGHDFRTGREYNELTETVAGTDSFKCMTDNYYIQYATGSAERERRKNEIEALTQNFLKNKPKDDTNVVKVPVVVHIVYNLPLQNISNARVQSQIDVLNQDFRRGNADTVNTPSVFKHLTGDSRIEFVLAKRDQLGNPTIGITRTHTNLAIFRDQKIKFTDSGGCNIWDRNKYLNIWLGNIEYAGAYTQLPGYDSLTDGVVLHYIYFGTIGSLYTNNRYGRVATHEIGHWFNLQHLWGMYSCGTDYVDDTPTQEGSNYGCPGFPHITCSNGPNGDMFMNHMDGTADECKSLYTIGQVSRMRAALNTMRSGLIVSDGRIPVSGVPITHFRSDRIKAAYGESVNFYDESGGIPTSWQWVFEGGVPSVSNQQNAVVNYPNAGVYSVSLKVSNSHGTDSVVYINYIKITGAGMSLFNAVHPPSVTTIHTSNTDTSKSVFKWNRSGTHSTLRYKWKMRKSATPNEYALASGSEGTDTSIYLRNSFLDSLSRMIEPGKDSVLCIWKAVCYNGADSLASVNELLFMIKRSPVGIRNISTVMPLEYNLQQNYPNPFNPETIIKFGLPHEGNTEISIYDITGRKAETLLREHLNPGNYEIIFSGGVHDSGIYFCLMIVDGRVKGIRKMVLVK